jgi:hypothetical protein
MKLGFRSKRTEEIFCIEKLKKGKFTLEDMLKQFNIDDYIIIKGTRNFRVLDKKDFLNNKYCGYTFIRKDIFNRAVSLFEKIRGAYD